MLVFKVDFLVFIHLKCFAVLILLSAVDLQEYVDVTNENVDGDEVVADWLDRHVKVVADDELESVTKCQPME